MRSTPHDGGLESICALNRSTDAIEFFTGGKDKKLLLWRVDPARQREADFGETVIEFPIRHSSGIRAVCTGSDGLSVYTGSSDRKVLGRGPGMRVHETGFRGLGSAGWTRGVGLAPCFVGSIRAAPSPSGHT